MKRLYFLVCLLTATLSIQAQAITEYNLPPAPLLKCGDVPAKLNQILYGAIPPNSNNKPVVVFVHGWGDNGFSFFAAKNDWYKRCYQEGFRTAFLFQSNAGAFQDNGKVVAEMLKKIIAKYNTNNVVLLGHSKGGVDIEWALYNYGMAEKVNGVITMSSPFYGVPLVEWLANPIIRTIAEIIPIVSDIVKGAGTFQMQPSYSAGIMRPMFDNHPLNNPEKFRCFGAYGANHITELPQPTITDETLKLLFYDYKPLCIDLPLGGSIGGFLVSLPMMLGNILNGIIVVPKQYQNKAGDTKTCDGVAPYYSSMRPGSVEISSTSSPVSNINHIDEVFAKYTWEMVKENVYYFNEHPHYTKNQNQPLTNNKRTIAPDEIPSSVTSNAQLIQDNKLNFKIGANSNANLILLGNYSKLDYIIYDNQNKEILKSTTNNEAKSIFDFFKGIDIKQFPEGDYTLKSNQPINAILVDDSKESIALDITKNKLSVHLENWSDNIDNINIEVIANRNIDENGKQIWDKLIPIKLTKDAVNNSFVNNEFNLEAEGNYNISVYAKSNTVKRFISTGYYNNKSNKNLSDLFSIKIYPNPASGDFTVDWNSDGTKNIIRIIDLQGKTIYTTTKDVDEYSATFNTKALGLQHGIYLININGKSEKLVVQ